MKYLFSFAFFMFSMSIVIGQSTGLSVGDVAPDFSLKGTDGAMHSLAKAAGDKGSIVIFTCNHCPYSVAYEDRIIELQKTFGTRGYNVIAINPNDPEVKPDDSFEAMGVRAKEKGFNFPYLFDDGQKVYPVWGATKTPHVFLLDASNKVRYIGAIDNNTDVSKASEFFVADAIAALEAGKDPNPATTKAIGCSIKTNRG